MSHVTSMPHVLELTSCHMPHVLKHKLSHMSHVQELMSYHMLHVLDLKVGQVELKDTPRGLSSRQFYTHHQKVKTLKVLAYDISLRS